MRFSKDIFFNFSLNFECVFVWAENVTAEYIFFENVLKINAKKIWNVHRDKVNVNLVRIEKTHEKQYKLNKLKKFYWSNLQWSHLKLLMNKSWFKHRFEYHLTLISCNFYFCVENRVSYKLTCLTAHSLHHKHNKCRN